MKDYFLEKHLSKETVKISMDTFRIYSSIPPPQAKFLSRDPEKESRDFIGSWEYLVESYLQLSVSGFFATMTTNWFKKPVNAFFNSRFLTTFLRIITCGKYHPEEQLKQRPTVIVSVNASIQQDPTCHNKENK